VAERSEWDAFYAPLLATLAAALEPVPLEKLRRWSEVNVADHAPRRLLRETWGTFEQELGGAESRYRPYHLSLREFLAGEQDPERFPPGIAGLLRELRERHGCCTMASAHVCGLSFNAVFMLQINAFSAWTMLVSNQRPLPCEGSAIGCWGFLELAESPQIADFLCQLFSQHFRRFTRVAARLLHRRYGCIRARSGTIAIRPAAWSLLVRASS
jgi:hypothetical protein